MGGEKDRKPASTGISDAEWEVMRVLWQRSPRASAEVAAALEERTGWHPKTVQTLLGRLVKKGVVDYEPEAGRYLYRPAVLRREAVRAAGRSFLDRVFAGDATELLLHFAGEAELTPETAEELRRLLDNRDPSLRPDGATGRRGRGEEQ